MAGARITAFAIAVSFLMTCVQAQSLAPAYPSKKYIHLNSQVIAIENASLADVGNEGFESGNLSS